MASIGLLINAGCNPEQGVLFLFFNWHGETYLNIGVYA